MRVGQVAAMWRYPVKSFGGEALEQAESGRAVCTATVCGRCVTSNATSPPPPAGYRRC